WQQHKTQPKSNQNLIKTKKIRKTVESSNHSEDEYPTDSCFIIRYLFTLGEVVLHSAQVKTIPRQVLTYVQALLPPILSDLSCSNITMTGSVGLPSSCLCSSTSCSCSIASSNMIKPIQKVVDPAVRAHAFVTLGKQLKYNTKQTNKMIRIFILYC